MNPSLGPLSGFLHIPFLLPATNPKFANSLFFATKINTVIDNDMISDKLFLLTYDYFLKITNIASSILI